MSFGRVGSGRCEVAENDAVAHDVTGAGDQVDDVIDAQRSLGVAADVGNDEPLAHHKESFAEG